MNRCVRPQQPRPEVGSALEGGEACPDLLACTRAAQRVGIGTEFDPSCFTGLCLQHLTSGLSVRSSPYYWIYEACHGVRRWAFRYEQTIDPAFDSLTTFVLAVIAELGPVRPEGCLLVPLYPRADAGLAYDYTFGNLAWLPGADLRAGEPVDASLYYGLRADCVCPEDWALSQCECIYARVQRSRLAEDAE